MAASRSPQLRLLHIRDEIDGLSAALVGVTFETYRRSYAFRRITERALQIISEAARALRAPGRARKGEEKKVKTSVPYEKIFATFSSERQRKIKKRAAELIVEEYTLQGLRKAKRITQEEVARRLIGRQVYVSRLERRADMKLSTLREYVRALGGDLQLLVTFPGDEVVKLQDIGTALVLKRRNVGQRSKVRKIA
jgi:hypothetical protein